jgi:hypothetical protein
MTCCQDMEDNGGVGGQGEFSGDGIPKAMALLSLKC